MPVFGGGTREIDVIPWQMAQIRHVDDSAAFGRRVEAELKSVVPMSPRPLQTASLRVLVGANMPAVVVEMGYLTNPGQEDALASGAFQARLAQALANAIVQFDSAMRTLTPQLAPGAGR
jgi:N-acetylmuramoyl-L-alanine amidase